MIMKAPTFLLIPVLILTACTDNRPANKTRGPIVLGDSANIVTVTDPKLLEDRLPDLQPPSDDPEADQPAAAPADTAAASAATQPSAPPAAEPEQPSEPPAPTAGNGLTVGFKEVTVFLPNITARTFGRGDLRNARSATYQLTGGNLAGAQLRTSGGTVNRVTQRYQTIIAIRNGSQTLPLETLGATSPTQTLRGGNGTFPITGLEPARLVYAAARPAAIRSAVQQAARKKRMNRSETQKWLDAVRNIRAANQAPATVLLRSVTWRLEGKDAAGKSFTKELRMDLPI